MKTTAKDIILLCKGWYDKEKYPTILEALKQYYRKYYSEQFEEQLNERFLLKILLLQTMQEIAKDYPDRLIGFVNEYLIGTRWIYDYDENNQDYDYQMFYRIINFLANLQIKGHTFCKEIVLEDYFMRYENRRLKEDII